MSRSTGGWRWTRHNRYPHNTGRLISDIHLSTWTSQQRLGCVTNIEPSILKYQISDAVQWKQYNYPRHGDSNTSNDGSPKQSPGHSMCFKKEQSTCFEQVTQRNSAIVVELFIPVSDGTSWSKDGWWWTRNIRYPHNIGSPSQTSICQDIPSTTLAMWGSTLHVLVQLTLSDKFSAALFQIQCTETYQKAYRVRSSASVSLSFYMDFLWWKGLSLCMNFLKPWKRRLFLDWQAVFDGVATGWDLERCV